MLLILDKGDLHGGIVGPTDSNYIPQLTFFKSYLDTPIFQASIVLYTEQIPEKGKFNCKVLKNRYTLVVEKEVTMDVIL